MFSADYKTVLAHSTTIAEKIASELDANGFVDGPYNIKKLLPLNNQNSIEGMLQLLPVMRAKLFERVRGASGMTEGEIVCLSYISELFGVLKALFVLPTIEHPDAAKIFPLEATDGIRKIEMD